MRWRWKHHLTHTNIQCLPYCMTRVLTPENSKTCRDSPTEPQPSFAITLNHTTQVQLKEHAAEATPNLPKEASVPTGESTLARSPRKRPSKRSCYPNNRRNRRTFSSQSHNRRTVTTMGQSTTVTIIKTLNVLQKKIAVST